MKTMDVTYGRICCRPAKRRVIFFGSPGTDQHRQLPDSPHRGTASMTAPTLSFPPFAVIACLVTATNRPPRRANRTTPQSSAVAVAPSSPATRTRGAVAAASTARAALAFSGVSRECAGTGAHFSSFLTSRSVVGPSSSTLSSKGAAGPESFFAGSVADRH